jgi:hypothetical protein
MIDVAQTQLIPGFPEIIEPHHRCRLCNLAQEKSGLVRVIHELYRRGMSGRPLLGRVAPLFRERDEPPPSPAAIMRHMEKHVDVTLISTEWMQKDGPDLTAIEGGDALPEVDHYEVDYLELRKLYNELRPLLREARADLKKKHASEEDKISGYDIVMLLKLFGEARQILKTLSDMRNSDRLTTVILVRHTRQLIHFLAEPLGVSLRSVRDRLLRGDAVDDVVEDITTLIEGDLDPLFEQAAERALEQSRTQYRLQ